jgi:hypothetical protein
VKISRSDALKVALGASAAALLLWLSVDANIRRSCAVRDATLDAICADVPALDSVSRLAELRHRISGNPGDSGAYAGLAHFPHEPDRPALLRAATALAPNDPNVLRARAALALEENRLADAATHLVQLTDHYHHLTQEPARTLVWMIAAGHGALLEQHLKPGSRWFPLAMATMVELKAPVAPALPLLSRAGEIGAISPERISVFIRVLKAEGSWVDAYGLWLAQHKGRVPILYNASFDQPLQADSFDWEVTPVRPGREGASVTTRSLSGRGQVVEIAYTGRSMPIPILRQYLFLAPGRYRLSGQYMTSKLRTEGGLAWSIRCVNTAQRPAGRTSALGDTRGEWLPLSFEVNLPENCGPVASLQLETFDEYESTAGIRGRALFDSFSLVRTGS